MAKYTLKGSLSQKGIESLIKQVDIYQHRILPAKCELLIKSLLQKGINVVRATISQGLGDAPKSYSTPTKYTFDVSIGKYVGSFFLTSAPQVDEEGRVFYPHLAWEFGAGIEYNNGTSHPQAAEFGLGVGTFPDQRHAINPGYWYYRDGLGQLHLSLGTKAEMPMYKASIEIIRVIESTAREVFGNGE